MVKITADIGQFDPHTQPPRLSDRLHAAIGVALEATAERLNGLGPWWLGPLTFYPRNTLIMLRQVWGWSERDINFPWGPVDFAMLLVVTLGICAEAVMLLTLPGHFIAWALQYDLGPGALFDAWAATGNGIFYYLISWIVYGLIIAIFSNSRKDY